MQPRPGGGIQTKRSWWLQLQRGGGKTVQPHLSGSSFFFRYFLEIIISIHCYTLLMLLLFLQLFLHVVDLHRLLP